jgi:hypothetical protein
MLVQFAQREAGFNESNPQTLAPGEAFLIQHDNIEAFIARDAYSRKFLSLKKSDQSPNDLFITEEDIKSTIPGNSIKLSIHNTTNAAIEVCWLPGTSPEESDKAVTLARLAPGGSASISGRGQNIYVARIHTSKRAIQTFITNEQASQTFKVSLHSRASDVSSKLLVGNKSTLSLALQWIDFDGTLRATTKLEPGQEIHQATFLSHPWILRDLHSGLVVDAFIPGSQSHQWIFEAANLRSIGATKPTVVEFWNASPFLVNLIWRDHAGQETLVDTLLPGGRRIQPCKAGHLWEMRKAIGNDLIKTFLPSPAKNQVCAIIPRDEDFQLPPEITFDNDSGLTVELAAKDSEGVERVFATVPNRGIQKIPTTTADRWFIRDVNSGQVVEEVVTSQENFTHRIMADWIFSQNMKVEVEAEFINTTPFTVDVSWIDYDGKEEPFYRLNPGQRLLQPTNATHVWRFRERETRDVLHLFVANEEAQQKVEIVMRPLHSRESAMILFQNYTGLTVEVVWFDAEGKPMVLRTLIPGRHAAFNTFASHAWALRDKWSGTILRTIVAQTGDQTATLNQADIRSKRSDRGTQLIFQNQMPFSVDIHWIDYDGLETPHETLRPGERLVKNSYTTQPYRFRHHITKREVGVFLPKNVSRQAVDIALRAYESSQSTSVEVRNMTALTVNVFAVDYKGKEQLNQELNPREGTIIQTFSTHPVVVRDKVSKEPLAFTIAGDQPQLLDVTSENLRSNRTEYPVWIKWENTLQLPVDIYWVKYDGSEEHMKTLQPKETVEISTYPTHVWRAKFQRAGTEVDFYIAGGKDKQIRKIGTVPPVRTQMRESGELWPGEVALYEKPNFNGRVWVAHGDLPDFKLLTGFDNTIASLKLARNTAVTVFEDSYFNALPQDLGEMAIAVREKTEQTFRKVLQAYIDIIAEVLNKLKEDPIPKIVEQVNLIDGILKRAVKQAPEQIGFIIERFVNGNPVRPEERLSRLDFNQDSEALETALQAVLQSREFTEDRHVFAEAVIQALYDTQNAIFKAASKEWDAKLDEKLRDKVSKPLDVLGDSLVLAAKSAGDQARPLVQQPASDVFHVEAPDLHGTDIGRSAISSIRVLQNYAPEKLRISSTNKVADDPQIKDGKLSYNPVYRTILKFPPEVEQVQVWATEEMSLSIAGEEYEIGPKVDQFAQVKPNMGGSLIIQIKPDSIGIPPLMIRTNSMPANARVFIFPDADIYRRIVKLDEEAFVKGIPDDQAPGGRRKLKTKQGVSDQELLSTQQAMQTLSKTSAASVTNNATGSGDDRRLVVNRMDMSAFQLDFGSGERVADTAFRPIDPAKVYAQAANAEEYSQGFFDWLEDIGEGIIGMAVAVVDVVEAGIDHLEYGAGQTARFFEDTGKAIAKGFEDAGQAIEKGFEAIGDAFEEAGEWLQDRIQESLAFIEDVIEEAAELMENIGSAIADAAQTVVEGVSKGLQVVIQTTERAITVVVDTLEKVGQVVAYVAKQVVEAVEQMVDFLCSLFNWDDIMKTHDMLSQVVDKGFDTIDTEIVKFQQKAGEVFVNARSSMRSMLSDARKAIGVEDLNLSAEDDNSDVMDAIMWFFDKITSGIGMVESAKGKLLEAATPDIGEILEKAGVPSPFSGPQIDISDELQAELESVGDIFINLIKNMVFEGVDACLDIIKSVTTRIGDIIEEPSRAPQLLGALFLDIGEVFIDTGLTIAAEIVDAFLQLARVLVKFAKAIIDTVIEIPFVADLYKLITDGRDLTLRSAGCLLLAIPATIIGKLTFGMDAYNNSVIGLAQEQGQAQPDYEKYWDLHRYGVCHIVLGLIEPCRDVQNSMVQQPEKRTLNNKKYLGAKYVLAGLSWASSVAAIHFSRPIPYPWGSKGLIPSQWCWGMQIPELLNDFVRVLGDALGGKIHSRGSEAFNKITGVFDILVGGGHLAMNIALYGQEETDEAVTAVKELAEKDDYAFRLRRTGYITTTFPVILGGFLSMISAKGKPPTPPQMVVIGLLSAGRALSHWIEGFSMMDLAGRGIKYEKLKLTS